MATVTMISAGALAISIVTLVLTQVQRFIDTRRIVRQQLTDSLVRIADMSLQWKKSPDEGEWLSPAISTEARNASALIGRLPPSLVNDADYVSLAAAFQYDPIEAKWYYEKAIETSTSNYSRNLCRGGYAAHLFLVTGDYSAGREQYTKALDSLSDSSDECHARRAGLYRSWASLEEATENHEQAIELQRKAADEIAKIHKVAFRKWYSQDQSMTAAGQHGKAGSSQYPGLYLPDSGNYYSAASQLPY